MANSQGNDSALERATQLVHRWERRAAELRGRDDARADVLMVRAEVLESCAAELDAVLNAERAEEEGTAGNGEPATGSDS